MLSASLFGEGIASLLRLDDLGLDLQGIRLCSGKADWRSRANVVAPDGGRPEESVGRSRPGKAACISTRIRGLMYAS
jgi:hypothetical protein